ncbi:uncharacterized protein N7515_005863 [Penicillium bovifimosum]|uniref:Major facilitator superfamily (MFS) profile domain-containing protein n=1 Tax=Penicillium bovifimosum TaxID=126998 RepID=A0A9W9GTK2_9EURO|nr:uncharacterized protein N7515_005863 [Penicillium bovifimosum]KAJ5129824.1 hypothetical protein N7515_005863 [Penicillium bovifimosum]
MTTLRPGYKSQDLDDEKACTSENVENYVNITTVDDIHVLGLSAEDAEFYSDFTPEQRKAVLWKVDIRLVPMLATLYLVSHLDRANIGNAKIAGMTKDLGLTGIQYNIALSLFFIPYVLLEVPSNIILKRFSRPSTYLGILIVSWGIVMTLTGCVRNFGGLVAVRIILGVFEYVETSKYTTSPANSDKRAGFFPGAVYLCSFWYMPRDLATRISLFYCASALAGAFSGLLAAGIARMDGVGGYEGWRWIFVLEGLLTVVLGVMCFFLLIDSPKLSGRWLDQDEIRYLELQHFIKEGGNFKEEQKKASWKDVKAVISNWRMYLLAYILLCQSACSYGTKFTLPTITTGMGFKDTNAQLMTVPPYVAGAISAVFFSKLSDRFYWRMPFVAAPLLLIIIGYSIIVGLKGDLQANIGPGFFAIVLTCMGIYPTHPATTSWTLNNLAPSNRRAVGSAFNICVGNIGGIVGSYMYLDREAPAYPTGFGLSLAFGGTAFLAAVIVEVSWVYANRKNAAMTEMEIRETYTDDQLLEMGDKSPLFKYTL